MIFTPGDIVFFVEPAHRSSRRRHLRIEKLLTLMEPEDITFDDLREALDRFGGTPRPRRRRHDRRHLHLLHA